MAPAAHLRDVRSEFHAGRFDRRVDRVRLLVVDGERREGVRTECDDEGEDRADADRLVVRSTGGRLSM